MQFNHLSDQMVLEQVGERFKAARLSQDLSVNQLAELAGLTGKTISNLENGKKSTGLLNLIAILRALNMLDELEGFIPAPPPRAAAVVRRSHIRGRTRQRASKKPKREPATNSTWTWGDE